MMLTAVTIPQYGWSQALADYCAAHGVRYVRVPTAVPPAELVVGALRREGLVRIGASTIRG